MCSSVYSPVIHWKNTNESFSETYDIKTRLLLLCLFVLSFAGQFKEPVLKVMYGVNIPLAIL